MCSPGSTSSFATEDVVDRLQVMIKQETSCYAYNLYLAIKTDKDSHLNVTWREKICQWAYNVVDHFDLSREVVAVALDLFDRYLATCGNQCNGSQALLVSLTTLAIAIKLFDHKRIKISTLANLSRGQFGPKDIEKMEFKILEALKWRLHPPTQYSFVSHMVEFLPGQVPEIVRKEVYEMSKYLTELAVCDSYFIAVPNSVVALASVLNVLEDTNITRISASSLESFKSEVRAVTGLDDNYLSVHAARERLATMFVASSGDSSLHQLSATSGCNTGVLLTSPTSVTPSPSRNERPPLKQELQNHGSNHHQQQQNHHHHDFLENRSISSNGSVRSGARSRTNSIDSKGSYRYSPSPRRLLFATGGASSRACVSSSPIVAGVM